MTKSWVEASLKSKALFWHHVLVAAGHLLENFSHHLRFLSVRKMEVFLLLLGSQIDRSKECCPKVRVELARTSLQMQ